LKFRTLRHKADENVHREAIRRAWAKEPLSNDPDAMAVWRAGVTGAFGEESVDMTLLASEKH
jgi:hypothetical protein